MTNIMDEESLTELLKDLDIELIPKRNELCYCGSREKYKYCCLEKDQKPKEIVHLEFDVCDDPFVLLDQGEALSIEDEDKLLNIIDLLDEDDSNADAELIADLQAMAKTYHNPLVWENLERAYDVSENNEHAEKICREIEKLFPDYLYSKIIKSNQFLEGENIDGFKKCFNDCQNLPMLYPSRDIFHFSEIGLFHLQWLRYCGLTSDLRSGEGHYMILNQLFEQDHSYLRHAQLMIEYLRYLRKIAIFSNRFPKLDERELGS